MDLFGFEEDLDFKNSEVTPCVDVHKPQLKIVSSCAREKFTISQIQELLLKDIANDTTSDQDTFQESDTSIFEEAVTSSTPVAPKSKPRTAARRAVKNIENTATSEPKIAKSMMEPPKLHPKRAVKTVLQNVENTSFVFAENSTQSNMTLPVTRAYSKPKRRKKVLQSIENTSTENINPKFNPNAVKRKPNMTKKEKLKNDENEKVNHIEEEINNKFRKVAQHSLIVE